MACNIKFKEGNKFNMPAGKEMSEADFYAWAMDNIDLEKFKKTGSIVYIDKKAEEVKFSAIRKLASNIQKSFQLLFGKNVEVITDTKEIDRILAMNPDAIQMEQEAWHGSPYDIDEFKTEKIGTGEGAQAFGWGLYFTDLIDIARNYANKLTKKGLVILDNSVYDNISAVIQNIDYASSEKEFFNILENPDFGNSDKTFEDIINEYHFIKSFNDRAGNKRFENYLSSNNSEYIKELSKTYYDLLESNKSNEEKTKEYNAVVDKYKEVLLNDYKKAKSDEIKVVGEKKRHLYKVTIHKGKTPDQYTWLEWDNPFSSKKTLDLFSKLNIPEYKLFKEFVDIKERQKNVNLQIREIEKIGNKLLANNKATNEEISNYLNEIRNKKQELKYNEINKSAVDKSAVDIETKLKETRTGRKLADIYENGFIGEDVYDFLSSASPEWKEGVLYDFNDNRGSKWASLFLLENGIDGVKYPAESIATGATSDTARGFNYVVFDENAITIEEKIQFMRNPQGKVLGFVYEGKVYIDPRTASPTTPIHEFGHIWNAYVKENHKAFYKKGISLIKQDGGAYIEQVKRDYPHLAEKGREDELYEEALAQAIGDRGARILKQNSNSFLSWLKEMWTLVKGSMKLSVSAEALSKMTLNDYTNLVAGSMLKGSEIYALAQAEATSQATSNPKVIKQAVKNLIAVKDKILISVSKLSRELYKAESQGYVAGKKAAAAIEKAKAAYQKEVRKILKENGIPVTLAIEKAISKIKDEMSFAKMLPKIFELDNAGVRLAQIDNIKDLVKKVKKLRKNKSKLSSSDIDYINSIEFPSPYQVFNLEGYAKVLSDLEKNLSKKELIGTDTKLALDNFLEQELDYIQEYKDMMEKIKAVNNALKWKQEYAELKEDGVFAGTDIKTEEDWLGLKERINSKGEDASTKDKEAIEEIEAKANEKAKALQSLKDSVKDLMKNNKEDIVDSFKEYEDTSTPLDYDQIFNNIDNLSYNQLVKLANEIENIIFYNDPTGIGAFASLGRLNSSFQDIKRVASKAVEDVANKLLPLAEKISESQTISQMISEITRGGASIEKLKNFIMGNFETMISKVQSQYNKSFKEFRDLSTSLFGKKAFEHWTRIDTYLFINQWVKNDTIEERNRTFINRVKNRADQHIAFLKGLNPYDKNPNTILDKKQAISGLKALQDFGVIKNLNLANFTYELADNVTTETIAGKLDKKEQELYNFLLNKFRDLSNYRNAMSINYDTEYDDIENYFPTFPEKTYQTEDAKIEDLEKSFVRFSKDNGRAKGRTKNLASSYKIGLIENFSKGYWDALIIDMGSSELLDMANILNNTKFGLERLSQYGLGETSIKILKNAIGEKVIAEKNGGMVYGNADKALRMETKRLISNISAGLLLKGANQIFKQPIPAMLVNFSMKPEAATLATRILLNSDFNRAVSNLVDSSTIKYRLNVYEINPSDLGFPVEYFDALAGEAFSNFQGKRFAAIKATESLQKVVSDPLYSLTKLVNKSSYDSFLEASDAYISKINILTAYIEHQKAAGKSFEEIITDLNNNKVNQSALKYAEKWQADLNSESKRANMSKKLKGNPVLFYMKGFSVTTHQSFAQSIRKLRDKEVRKSMDDSEVESWKATRNAFLMQQIMFRLVSMAVSNWTIASIIQAVTKNKPDDDDEELIMLGIELGASMVSDIFLGSTSVIGGMVWAGIVNALWAVASDKIIEKREEESIADSNRKKLKRPIANAGQAGGAEVALVNFLTRILFDSSDPSVEKVAAGVGGFGISAIAGSKEVYDATRKFSNTLEREANVSTLIDEELNTDLANYSYQISEEDRKEIVKELKNSTYRDIRSRLYFNQDTRELCLIPKDSYKKVLKDARTALFGIDSENIETIKNTQWYKIENEKNIYDFILKDPNITSKDVNKLTAKDVKTIERQQIIQAVRTKAKELVKNDIMFGDHGYGIKKYKVKNIEEK